jgi:hypothetical protein
MVESRLRLHRMFSNIILLNLIPNACHFGDMFSNRFNKDTTRWSYRIGDGEHY